MIQPLAGGMLIGIAALLLYSTLGRIAGASGIAYGALWGGERPWRLAFLAGLAAGAWLALWLGAPAPQAPSVDGAAPALTIMVAGVLVGAGTRLGNGCTSGHGVCGLARLSRRSGVAVAVFMSSGVLTATLLGILE